MTQAQYDQLRQDEEAERRAWLEFLKDPCNHEKDKAWQEASRRLIDGITGTYPVTQFERRPDEGLLE